MCDAFVARLSSGGGRGPPHQSNAGSRPRTLGISSTLSSIRPFITEMTLDVEGQTLEGQKSMCQTPAQAASPPARERDNSCGAWSLLTSDDASSNAMTSSTHAR
ncbi:hypothetical protein J3459_022461 [Metarhizium acridum]|uniref:uncharacterized protein n=1 Tax=Metarhizium acridum TaxID=92637 RepID=UPI001C6B4FCC|nr:hypothetical protein J3459_022461 [Metarhizium acridum]KAG8425400.1 hypothetical protein J3458_022436 [Metarhizium acridum]